MARAKLFADIDEALQHTWLIPREAQAMLRCIREVAGTPGVGDQFCEALAARLGLSGRKEAP